MAKNYYPDAVKKYKAKAYKQVSFSFPREFVERFEKKLESDGIGKAEFFRGAMKAYLGENEPTDGGNEEKE